MSESRTEENHLSRFLFTLGIVVGFPAAVMGQVPTSIVTDGSLPSTVPTIVADDPTDGLPDTFVIEEDLGYRNGLNLFHSFETFNVGAGDTALFTANGPTSNVLGRVTGGDASSIYGTIASDIVGADLYLMNSNGFMFGPDANLDLKGSFHVTTADYLELSNPNDRFYADRTMSSVLSSAAVSAYGFLGTSTGDITIDRSSLLLDDEPGQDFSLVARDIRIAGIGGEDIPILGGYLILEDSGGTQFVLPIVSGILTAGPGGSLGSATGPFPVRFEPQFEVDGELFRVVSGQLEDSAGGELPALPLFRGELVLTDKYTYFLGIAFDVPGSLGHGIGEVVAGNGQSLQVGYSTSAAAGPSLRASGEVGLVAVGRGSTSIPVDFASVAPEALNWYRPGAITLDDGASVVAGQGIVVRGGTLAIEGSSRLALYRLGFNAMGGDPGPLFTGPGSSTGIDVGVREEASIAKFSSITIQVLGVITSESEGLLVVRAPRIIVSGHISYGIGDNSDSPSGESEFGGITLEGEEIVISGEISNGNDDILGPREGLRPITITGKSSQGIVTITGTIRSIDVDGGLGGNIHIRAPTVEIIGGRVEAISETDANGNREITIEGDSVLIQDSRIAASLYTTAGPGNPVISVYANDSLEIVADSLIEILSHQTEAGEIRLEAPAISIDASNIRGVGIGTTESFGSGAGASVFVAGDRVELVNGARVDTATNTEDDAGSITFDARVIRLKDGSEVSSESLATQEDVDRDGNLGDPPGNAGAVTLGLASGKYNTELVVLDDSAVSTSVVEPTLEGGEIAVNSETLVLFGKSSITANGAPDSGLIDLSGVDTIFASGDSIVSFGENQDVDLGPDSTVVNQINPIPVKFQDPPFEPSCVAQASGGKAGSFVVARRRGLPFSPEGRLAAFHEFGTPKVAKAETAEDTAPLAGAPTSDEEQPEVVQVAMVRGATAFRGGHFEEASEQLHQAVEYYTEIGDPQQRGEALRGLAQSQQALGDYTESVDTLEAALALAEQTRNSEALASVLSSLGNAYVALEQPDMAQTYLERGVVVAKDAGQPKLLAELLTNLGNHQATQGAFDEALEAYEESARIAAKAGDRVGEASALTNAGRTALEAGKSDRAAQLLNQAHRTVQQLPADHETISIRIHLAKSFEQLAAVSPEMRKASLLSAHAQLTAAIQLGRQLDDPRLLSYALGNLGALYQSEQRVEEALYLTREALKTAERADASDSLYRWHWQEGQLLWAQGQTQAAVESYQRAVDILEETRQETLGRYGASASYFGQSLAPVYLELTSALLIAAGRLEGTESFDALLKNARQTMEQLKAAELRNYFRNDCVADLESKERPLELVADNAAVIYPILLPDRVELLVSGPSGLARYPVPVPGPQVSDMARSFRRNLQTQTSGSYLEPAKSLYDWLVRPYASQLEKQGVDTLIFVPDGVLRTIPMTALHDGEKFLGTQFAIGVTPGLSLVDPQRLDRDHTTLLLGGLSESAGGFDALPKVADEIRAIEALYGGEVLLDGDFQMARIETALIEDPPSIAHLASHAVFTGNPETSFLLTHDGKLTLDEMADLVGPTQYRKKPLELLLLSACETAAGDERAALGLAGVAIRSGARSAIGSLWKISDEAAYELVVAFYTELHDHPSISKAVALQRAQQKLLDGGRFAHPYFWSPYILIGNWL